MRVLPIAVVVLAGCSGQPGFKVDPNKPFSIAFGRGCGMFGLHTITIDHDGRALLHRIKMEQSPERGPMAWETAAMQLPPDAVAGLVQWINANELTRLDKQYHARIQDGTQWVLWIRQGDREKSTYFNNNFPAQITQFAEKLDGVMMQAGMEHATWRTVPESAARQHESKLWDSIRR